MSVKRWLYRGGRPNRAARFLDRITAALYARGVAPDYLVTLTVAGRRSGKAITFPLVMVVVDGESYVVSMLGDNANWVRNVRAAEGRAVLRHGREESVCLVEVEPRDRPVVLRTYLRSAPNARTHVPVSKDAPLADFAEIAAEYPVFRVMRDPPW
ncbi:nitroreductase/quinone reductase family protein [Saccharomonospora piscinae]|uniref:nitroreductase/quinone reductase family protein n=1 Tax=Saccharomonospora piscinae TaxID=687388 RepID=UPI000463C767|nr:nitroreductase/quinone reductase family protein [Saccharomonospora piscinae]